jgi:PTH1 family peptidyl-tRNA hydrolase
MSSPVRLVVGLGNPGRSYAATRHNAGAWFVEALAQSMGIAFRNETKFQAYVARAAQSENDVRLVLPQTFMNLSGVSVAAMAQFYRVPVDGILVAHDELDLKAGAVKLKLGGGTAGHNGLRDIAQRMGSPGFWRLRLGIGHPRDQAGFERAVVDYVLQPPRSEEQLLIEQAITRALSVWPRLQTGDAERAMHELHTRSESAAASGKG